MADQQEPYPPGQFSLAGPPTAWPPTPDTESRPAMGSMPPAHSAGDATTAGGGLTGPGRRARPCAAATHADEMWTRAFASPAQPSAPKARHKGCPARGHDRRPSAPDQPRRYAGP